jgi:hypothetical protein
MVWRAWTVAVLVAIPACSGSSTLHEESSGDGTGGTSGGSGAAGGSGGAGASGGTAAGAGDGGAAGSGGSAGTYVPDQTNVPPEGDGRVKGSFEGNLGDGWDFCFTNKAGAKIVRDDSEPKASTGISYMSFDSSLECTGVCSPDGDDAQFGFWLDAQVPAAEPVHLYFDAINLADEAPSGILQIDSLDGLCGTTEPLATIELEELSLTLDWQTRCATFAPTAPFQVFGAYVLGEAFHIGLDALRFGPPCHAQQK